MALNSKSIRAYAGTWVETWFNFNLLKQISGLYTNTIEQFADLLFSKYFEMLPCCRVSKNKYVSLDISLQNKIFNKAFYNNMCKNLSFNNLHDKFDYMCYKKSKVQKFCRGCKNAKGTSANLRDFYENTVLSDKLKYFECIKIGNVAVIEVKKGKSLDDLLG